MFPKVKLRCMVSGLKILSCILCFCSNFKSFDPVSSPTRSRLAFYFKRAFFLLYDFFLPPTLIQLLHIFQPYPFFPSATYTPQARLFVMRSGKVYHAQWTRHCARNINVEKILRHPIVLLMLPPLVQPRDLCAPTYQSLRGLVHCAKMVPDAAATSHDRH